MKFRSRAVAIDACLKPRDRQILELVTEGHRSKEVAYLLDLSQRTVDNRIQRMFRRIGVRSRVELVARTLQARKWLARRRPQSIRANKAEIIKIVKQAARLGQIRG